MRPRKFPVDPGHPRASEKYSPAVESSVACSFYQYTPRELKDRRKTHWSRPGRHGARKQGAVDPVPYELATIQRQGRSLRRASKNPAARKRRKNRPANWYRWGDH